MGDAITLNYRTIEGRDPGPKLLISGGVHGDEFEPMCAVRRLIRMFGTSDPATRLLRGRLTLVPVVNEAAFALGSRVAEDQLDLARVCPGSAQGTITQRTAFALSEMICDADYYIDLHTGGNAYQVLPLVGYTLHADPHVLEAQRKMAAAFGVPVIWGTSPNLDGRSLSVARDAGIPAIYAEYLGAGCDPAGIECYVNGCLNVMAHLELIERTVNVTAPQYHVEDTRNESGHMQVANPSPATGCFEPAVQLGDVVNPGDLLGTVSDTLGENACPVRASQYGVVIVLRAFPRVRQGESVGVVMELDTWQQAF